MLVDALCTDWCMWKKRSVVPRVLLKLQVPAIKPHNICLGIRPNNVIFPWHLCWRSLPNSLNVQSLYSNVSERLLMVTSRIRYPYHWSVRGIHGWPVDSPDKKPLMQNFGVFVVINMNKLFKRPSYLWWLETSCPWCSFIVISIFAYNVYLYCMGWPSLHIAYSGNSFTDIMGVYVWYI